MKNSHSLNVFSQLLNGDKYLVFALMEPSFVFLIMSREYTCSDGAKSHELVKYFSINRFSYFSFSFSYKYTGLLKKLFHYAIFQKFFLILYCTLMVYVLPYM